MKEKEIYQRLLLYGSYALMLIGGIKIVIAILNRLMSSFSISMLIFVIGALYYITYKKLYNKD